MQPAVIVKIYLWKAEARKVNRCTHFESLVQIEISTNELEASFLK